MSRRLLALAVALGVAAAGCGRGPVPIAYGTDECAHCRMRITDARFAAELVTRRGKAYKFDAIECLVGFLAEPARAAGEVRSVWVADFARPGELIDARSAHYLRTDRVRSPMGLNVLAFATAAARDAARARYAGDTLAWTDLPALRHGGAAVSAGTGHPAHRAPGAPPAP